MTKDSIDQWLSTSRALRIRSIESTRPRSAVAGRSVSCWPPRLHALTDDAFRCPTKDLLLFRYAHTHSLTTTTNTQTHRALTHDRRPKKREKDEAQGALVQEGVCGLIDWCDVCDLLTCCWCRSNRDPHHHHHHHHHLHECILCTVPYPTHTPHSLRDRASRGRGRA